MARIAMVTRTIVATNLTAIVYNAETESVSEKEYTLSGEYADNASALKSAKKAFDNEIETLVAIKSTTRIETLYGMTEQEFIAHAKKLPPRVKTEETPAN